MTKKRAQGGSTITMQLARNLYDTKLKQIGHEKTISRKIKEIILAIKIEQIYTKHEISIIRHSPSMILDDIIIKVHIFNNFVFVFYSYVVQFPFMN